MKIVVTHSTLGEGLLTDEHSASSYGHPVFVRANDAAAYGPGDTDGHISRPAGVAYDAEQSAWLDWLLSQPESPVKWRNGPGRPVGTTIPDADRRRARTVHMNDGEWARCMAQAGAGGLDASAYVRRLVEQDA